MKKILFALLCMASASTFAQMTPVGFPFDVIDRGGHPGVAHRVRTILGRLDRSLSRRWPNLFAYQYVAELRSTPEPLE